MRLIRPTRQASCLKTFICRKATLLSCFAIHLEHIVNDLLQWRCPSLGLRGGKRLLTQLCADGSHGLLIVGAVDWVQIIRYFNQIAVWIAQVDRLN